MRRLFWMSVGAAAGIYAVRRVSRAAEVLLPQNLVITAGSVSDSVRDFVEDVRAAMAQRENELTEALGLEPRPDTTRRAAIRGDLAPVEPHPAQHRRGTT